MCKWGGTFNYYVQVGWLKGGGGVGFSSVRNNGGTLQQTQPVCSVMQLTKPAATSSSAATTPSKYGNHWLVGFSKMRSLHLGTTL